MRPRGLLAAVGAATAALLVPALAIGASSAPTLSQAPDSGFPDKVYILQLPAKKALTASQVKVTENGQPVTGLSVQAPGTSSGAVLLIDSSKSMTGKPIAGAMLASRAFMAKRSADLPVAVVAFAPDTNVLTGFTTDKHALAVAVGKAPPLSEGTHIYDALEQVAKMAQDQKLSRSTVVLLSDGADVGSKATFGEALQALQNAGVRVIAVGLKSKSYDPKTLKSLAQGTGGDYLESATPAQLEPIFSAIGAELASQYVVTYRSLLPPKIDAAVRVTAAGYPPAKATYTTPALDLGSHGTFSKSWSDKVVASPFVMAFIIVAVIALLAFAVLAILDVRNRSLSRRLGQYVNVPSEEESRIRRAEVAALLADKAHRTVQRHRWWQSFESDVELGGFRTSAMALVGWTIIGGVLASIVAALLLHSLAGLLVGLVAPVVTRSIVKTRVSRARSSFEEQLPDNLDVLSGALRAGHGITGAMNVMVEGAVEPSKSEFRRVVQDEQLGVPIDQALEVTARRMDSMDVEQVALVTRLQREAGGNTAEILDRVVENIRGRQELVRLVRVLTTQGRLARYILTAMPICLALFLALYSPGWMQPLYGTPIGRVFLGAWVVMLVVGWFALKKITEIKV